MADTGRWDLDYKKQTRHQKGFTYLEMKRIGEAKISVEYP
jgi:hypothetical protein